MTIEIPPALAWVSYLAGSAWPKGDEDAMFRVGEHWHDAAATVTSLVPDLAKVRSAVGVTLAGDAARAAQDQLALLFTGDSTVDQLADAMAALGELSERTGTEIEYTKLQIISTLAISAAEIAWALNNAWATFGASLSWIPVIETTVWAAFKALLAGVGRRVAAMAEAALTRTGVKELGLKAVKAAAVEAGISEAQDLGIRTFQHFHDPEHPDVTVGEIVDGVVSGALGGAAGAVAHHVIEGAMG